MNRRDLQKLTRETDTEARRIASELRAMVLAHPDLANRLTLPPLSHPRPEQWNGYIPPYMVSGRVRSVRNDSPRRVHLVAICRQAITREHGEDIAGRWLAQINTDNWSASDWNPHQLIEEDA